ncbi:hypothetical protein ROZALSC1DRAFT_25894, partial [Rozella allomycis CSF55]
MGSKVQFLREVKSGLTRPLWKMHYPNEIWLVILSQLSLNDVKEMSRTSRQIRSLCFDLILHQAPEFISSWKCPYVIQYLIKHICGKMLTKDMCSDILNKIGYIKRFVSFINFMKQNDLSQNAANYAFQFACQYGLLHILQCMVMKISCKRKLCSVEDEDIKPEPLADRNFPIGLSLRNGQSKPFKYYLTKSGVDPSADDNYAIQHASEYGHADT